MLTVTQVAQRLNCSVSTIYGLITSGRLEHHRGPGVRVSEEQLEAYLEATMRGREPETPKLHRQRPRLRHISLS